jgi:hypothetical protein
MESLLKPARVSDEQLDFLHHHFFSAMEKAIFADPILNEWRNEISRRYQEEQSAKILRYAEESAGIYTEAQQSQAINLYCQKELASWDIIDLTTLPQEDIDVGTQKLLVRQLYMPLRVAFEPVSASPGDETMLTKLEQHRDIHRLREAGRNLTENSRDLEGLGKPVPIGERLNSCSRLVVLGDPGGGKTTMLR